MEILRRHGALVLALAATTRCGSSPAPMPTAPSSSYIKLTLLPNILDPAVAFSMGVGDSLQLRASGWTNSFTYTDITATARWQTSQPGVIAVSSTGTVTGVGPGVADVSAISQSVSASARFRVFGRDDIEAKTPFRSSAAPSAQKIEQPAPTDYRFEAFLQHRVGTRRY